MQKRVLNRGNVRDLVIVLALVSAYFFPMTTAMLVTALAVLALGTVLHVVTKATLVRNRVLCTQGVYQICRHPYYLANFTVDISLCLLSGNIYLVMAYPFLFFWAYGPTFQFEEEKLAGIFGQSFFDFTLKTPQVFPHGSSLSALGQVTRELSVSRVTIKEWVRISRFWAVGMLLPVVHEVSVRGVRILYIPPLSRLCLAVAGLALLVLLVGLFFQLLPKMSGKQSLASNGK